MTGKCLSSAYVRRRLEKKICANKTVVPAEFSGTDPFLSNLGLAKEVEHSRGRRKIAPVICAEFNGNGLGQEVEHCRTNLGYLSDSVINASGIFRINYTVLRKWLLELVDKHG